MSLTKDVTVLNRIGYLVEQKATGNPQQLASKIGVSERQLHSYMKDLRKIGFKIEYSHELGSYIYSNPN